MNSVGFGCGEILYDEEKEDMGLLKAMLKDNGVLALMVDKNETKT